MGNIVRKGEIACNKQFLLFTQCFLSHIVLIFHFKCPLKCRLQIVSIWTNLDQSKIVSSGNGLTNLLTIIRLAVTRYIKVTSCITTLTCSLGLNNVVSFNCITYRFLHYSYNFPFNPFPNDKFWTVSK